MVFIESKLKKELAGSFILRPVQPADAERLHALLIARDAVYDVHLADTVQKIHKELQDPWLQTPELDSTLVLTPSGEAAAFGLVFSNPEPEEKREAFLWVALHPEHEQSSLRKQLVSWAAQRAEEILAEQDAILPQQIGTGIAEELEADVRGFEAAGFQKVRYFYRMRRDLRRPIHEPSVPSGLQLVSYLPEKDQALLKAFNNSFADHWNFTTVTQEDWQLWFTGDANFHPELSFLILDGEEIAAFSINRLDPERNRQRGINEAWIGQLGTRRPWRRRGLATALLNASMQAFKQAGMDYAALGVDTENTTGALGIYERLGFKPYMRSVVLTVEKPGQAV